MPTPVGPGRDAGSVTPAARNGHGWRRGTVDHPELVPCPTGGHLAWAEVDEEANGERYADDPEESHRYDLFRSHLTCKLCGLAVETHEIEVLGLGAAIGERHRDEEGTVTDTYF